VLFDLAGQQLAAGRREWRHLPVPGVPGSQAFDTRASWLLICHSIYEALSALEDPAAVRAVSYSCMGGGLVLYDRHGDEVWACANGDARSDLEARDLLEGGDAERLYRSGGAWISLSAPPRLRWIEAHQPELWGSIAQVGMIGDWVLRRLTGEFATDPSMGSTSGMFDLATRTWAPAATDVAHLRSSALPDVVDAGTPVGSVSRSAAEMTGLRPGTIVVAGGVDTALALLGAGRGVAGALTISGGSFWKQSIVVKKPLIQAEGRLRTTCDVQPGRWMVEGFGFYAGLALRWFRDTYGRAALRRLPVGSGPYAALERLAAAAAPGANGVVADAPLVDAWTWARRPDAFLAPTALRPRRNRDGECVRAIEEAAAYVARANVESIEALVGTRFPDAVFTGGAAQGMLWPQILANVLGIPLAIPSDIESAARGAAAVAGWGSGLLSRPPTGEIPGPEQPARVVSPDPDTADAYDAHFQLWKDRVARTPASG